MTSTDLAPAGPCAHSWQLTVVPQEPVELTCSQCDVDLDTFLQRHAVANIYTQPGELPGFRIKFGHHDCESVRIIPVAVQFRESATLNKTSFTFESRMTVTITPMGTGPVIIELGPEDVFVTEPDKLDTN